MASSPRSGVGGRAAGSLLLAALLAGGAAGAQSGAPAAGSVAGAAREVTGRVVRPGASGPLPTSGVWVTLHRVGPDSAGPVDSLRAGADGRYAFRYRPWGSSDAVYFVSASYGGLAYFSEPLRAEETAGEAAEITVFDTTSAPVPLTVRGRHLIVNAPGADGARRVTEVYELSNDTSVTAVTPPDGATFAALVPAAATEARAGTGDVAEEAVRFADGRMRVSAPFAPGLKQLSFSYLLPASAFPLAIPLERGAQVLEVLVEEPGATVGGARLAAAAPVSVSGRMFKRFLGEEVPPNAVATVSVPAAPLVSRQSYVALLAAALGAAMLGALLRALNRRGRRRRAAPLPNESVAETASDRIAREIAALDAGFERQDAPSEEARAAYAERRAALKTALTTALAERGDG